MKAGISLKIDVTKIDKDRLFVGQKGKYLDATVFVDLDNLDEFGNSGMITQDVAKDEKDKGVKGAILGNAKVFWKDGYTSGVQTPNHPQAQTPAVENDFDSKIPF